MKIYVAGHTGMVGSAIVRRIESDGEHEWVGASRSELNLMNNLEVSEYVAQHKPDAVIIAAAKVGGIMANESNPVGFLTENLKIQTSLMEAAHQSGVGRLLFLGSSCIYPKDSPQPITENQLLKGSLEPSNQSYAVAKIAGIQMVNSYREQFGYSWISLMPTNLYGPNDNYDPLTSHVIPGMIAKFREAKELNRSQVILWGTGNPMREFMHVDDLASATMLMLAKYDESLPVNIGTGMEISIRELAQKIASLIGYNGQIVFDNTKPDGTKRKLLDITLQTKLGFIPKISLDDGLSELLAK